MQLRNEKRNLKSQQLIEKSLLKSQNSTKKRKNIVATRTLFFIENDGFLL